MNGLTEGALEAGDPVIQDQKMFIGPVDQRSHAATSVSLILILPLPKVNPAG
jgi:hypothetical protein